MPYQIHGERDTWVVAEGQGSHHSCHGSWGECLGQAPSLDKASVPCAEG